jgi:nicotinate-nucleotide pyrophosphorylase
MKILNIYHLRIQKHFAKNALLITIRGKWIYVQSVKRIISNLIMKLVLIACQKNKIINEKAYFEELDEKEKTFFEELQYLITCHK